MSDYPKIYEAENCSNCANIGLSVVHGNDGEPEQEQCEFCYTNPKSIFNVMCELQKENASLKQRVSELENPWIPVSERLPESGVKVIAQFKNSDGKIRTICAKYVTKFSEEDYESELPCDYSEEKDCYFVPEGWYETIENWAEYTFVTVDEGEIYQWQPITPPKGN
jgi:hypothetical protein